MPDTINTPSAAWEHAEKLRAEPRLLMAGTRELRKEDNAKVYIPPEPDELDEEWNTRVSRSVIFPFFKRAVSRAVGSILAKPIVLAEDVPVLIRGTDDAPRDGWWENVDLEGHDGNTFFAHVLKDAVGESGVSHVLAEFPPRKEGATLADLAAQGLRPYLVHVKDRSVIFAKFEVVGGRKRLMEVRIREPGKNKAGETVDQVRVLLTTEGFVRWEIHQDVSPEGSEKEDWQIVADGDMEPHTDIPLSTVRINVGETPFADLAHLNILHTQKYSDTGENIRVTSGAQLHRTGITEDEAKTQRAIGAKRLLHSTNESATAEWLERSGSGAVVAADDLQRLENRMDAISNEPHIRRTGDETATGRAIDAAEARTEVQAWAIATRDHIEEVLGFWARYIPDETTGGSVEIPTPPRHSAHGIEGLKFLAELRAMTGAPSLATILEEAQRLDYLSDDFSLRDETARLQEESEGMLLGIARTEG